MWGRVEKNSNYLTKSSRRVMWLFLDEEIKCKKLNILSWWFSFLTVIEGSKCLKFSRSFQFLMDFTAVNYKPLVSTVVLCIISCYKANSLEWWEAWQRSKYTGALDNHLLEVQGKMPHVGQSSAGLRYMVGDRWLKGSSAWGDPVVPRAGVLSSSVSWQPN